MIARRLRSDRRSPLTGSGAADVISRIILDGPVLRTILCGLVLGTEVVIDESPPKRASTACRAGWTCLRGVCPLARGQAVVRALERWRDHRDRPRRAQ